MSAAFDFDLDGLDLPPKRVSRYHALRGKSVSETPASVDDVLVRDRGQDEGRKDSFASWSLEPLKINRRRSRTLTSLASSLGDGAPLNKVAVKSPARRLFPMIPPLPLAQRDLSARPARSADDELDSNSSVLKPAPHMGVWRDDEVADTLPLSHEVHLTAGGPVAAAITVDEAVTTPIDRPDGGQHWPLQQLQPQLTQHTEDDDQRRKEQEEEEAELLVARLEAETDRILAEQRKRDMARQQQQRPQLQLSAPPSPSPSLSLSPSPSPSSSFSLKPRSPVLEKLSFLTRGRRVHGAALSPTSSISLRSPVSPTISPTSSIGASVDFGRPSGLEPSSMPPQFIEPGGRGLVPQMDALRGASNGVDRRVAVRCRGVTIDLMVGVETTAVDILLACADQMGQEINVNSSMLVEAYTHLGLERRLRRYERIRDMLNSWDTDAQNILIVSPDTLESDPDLDLASVPDNERPPAGFVLPVYHSHRPGKWNKRFITLLEGGQLFSSKKPDPTPADKDVFSLCHLSDYDIYFPTEAQMRKQLKPPKKYCYAIKSQQKTTVFVNTENYVHFFCTEDPNVAQKLHAYVHAWRSWYIVNRMLQLHAKKIEREAEPPPQIPVPVVEKHKPKKSISHVKVNGHKLKVSVDESPYAIGAFEPLIDLQRFDKPLDEFGKDWLPDRQSILPPMPPMPPLDKTISASGKSEDSKGAFAASGLLSSAYDERKQAQKEDRVADGPFTDGPNLLNSTSSPASTSESPTDTSPKSSKTTTSPTTEKKPEISWFPSALEHSAKAAKVRPPPPPTVTRPSTSAGPSSQYERDQQRRRNQQPSRSGGGRGPPNPLVNLAPGFVEAPQWSRVGKGRGVQTPEGVMLVDFATGPGGGPPGPKFLEVPPRNLVRRDGNSSSGEKRERTRDRERERDRQAQPAPQTYRSGDRQQPQSQRPSTSDGRPTGVRRPTVSSSSRRGDGSDLPPLPPLPPPGARQGFPLPPPPSRSERERPSTAGGHYPPPRIGERPSTSGGHPPRAGGFGGGPRPPPLMGGDRAVPRGRDPRPREGVREAPARARSGSVRI
ncbi:hypothetical protein B0H67DRAFT_198250 [Lasiosphaeris hirsuta]|uniref:PH domain-containing protein n=1 Tax=Lasiosphaeris hirsuta TaxID=260670 RepID=A0AA40ARH3_9PEZI|nr:hypothetical protein B0H67DRAFT_198250 [Lasiosphaeris hirsuta]